MNLDNGWARMSGVDRYGRVCTVAVRPAPAGTGIVFNGVLRACPGRARAYRHATWLMDGAKRVGMIEHLMAACLGLGVEDLEVRATGEELPLGDGSALPYVRLLRRTVTGSRQRRPLRLRRAVVVRSGSRFVAALPGAAMSVTCVADLSGLSAGFCRIRAKQDQFVKELASARTFARHRGDPVALRRRLRLGFALEKRSGWVVPRRRRFVDEECRHKALDLLGDVALLGRRVNARFVAFRPGHRLNLALVRGMERYLEAG